MEYLNSQIEQAINEVVHSERDRNICKRRFIDGTCYDELAEEFYLSTRQIKNIVYREKRKIKRFLEE